MTTKAEILQGLIKRQGKVLPVLHTPTAALARVMQAEGCEVGFVGTGGVIGGYTGLADVGALGLMECVQVAGWIADSVDFPVMIDGDTGHGGIMAVRRLVRECIRAGISGIRLDDQPLESKRKTQSAGLEVVPIEHAVARYRAAVDMKNELDPNFVVMAQCYARDASNGGWEDCLTRLKAYREDAGVDWVQLESPHSKDEIVAAREVVTGPFSFMKGKLPHYLSFEEHLALGVTIAWLPTFTHHIIWAAMSDFMRDLGANGIAAWDRFNAGRQNRPYYIPDIGPDGEGLLKQQELEKLYYAAEMLKKYEISPQ